MSTSAARLEANRANAQLSTGPTSAEGKAKISLNAVKTGLTGRTVLLPADDVAAYEALIADFAAKWQPANSEEQRLTQALADTEWRLMRVPELESGIYALGFRQLAAEFADIADEATRRSAIHTQIFITFARQLGNLSTQEGRLRRQREKDTDSLRQLQSARRAEVNRRLNEAAHLYSDAVARGVAENWDPTALGFEFSKADIEKRALVVHPEIASRRCSQPLCAA